MKKTFFKIGSFNLFNLVLPDVAYHETQIYTDEQYRKKTEWIARQLDFMSANLVGFQEIFHEEAFKEALAKSERFKSAQAIVAKPTGEGPVVGLASLFPILEHNIIEEFPTVARLDIEGVEIPFSRFSRPVLKVRVKVTDHLDLTVFVIHLKSKRPLIPEGADMMDPVEKAKGQARSLVIRGMEAAALRAILVKTLKDRSGPVIVIGDGNDSDFAVSTRIISGEAPWRKLQKKSRLGLWDLILYHVKNIQVRQSYSNVYYTYIYNGHYESLDHILVSREFLPQNTDNIGRVVYTSVFNDHLIDKTLGYETISKWQSDHGQVVATFEMNE